MSRTATSTKRKKQPQKIILHKKQAKAFFSKKRFVAAISGVQGGKTYVGAVKTRYMMDKYPLDDMAIIAPTYKILMQSTLQKWWEFNPELRKYWNKADSVITIPRGNGKYQHIFIRSTDNPLTLEGMTLKFAWLDEAGQMKSDAFLFLQARVAIKRGQLFITTTPYCYSEDTEIYTKDGWKTFGELTYKSQVFAVNKDGSGSFENPKEIIWEDYEGEMLEFGGHAVNLLVTPNHRVLFKNSNRRHTVTADHFYGLKKRFLSIPKAVYYTGIKDSVTIAGKEIKLVDWAAFMGWFLSEGSVMGSKGGKVGVNGLYKIVLTQKDGTKNKDIMREDISRLPFKFSEHKNSFHTTNKALWAYLSQFGNSHQKFIPREFNEWNDDAKKMFLDRMILGDGTYRHDRRGEFIYYTASERLAKTLQEFLLLMGISVKISKRKNKGGCIGGRKIKSGEIYHIAERKRKAAMVDTQRKIKYSGKVGCVTTSTGYVLVRRNGEECISGNSMNWLYRDFYKPCIEGVDGFEDFEVVTWASVDNPFFPKEEYERVKKTLDPKTFDRRYRGAFVKMEGLVYDLPSEAIIEPKELETVYTIAGVDFGYSVESAIIVIAEDKNGVFYVVDEYYRAEKTTNELIEVAKNLKEKWNINKFYCDSAEPDRINEFIKQGLYTDKSNKDIKNGISKVNQLLREGRLKIFKTCRNTLDEIETYHYPSEDDTESDRRLDLPVKKHDHAMDAMRYGLHTYQPGGITEPYVPVNIKLS